MTEIQVQDPNIEDEALIYIDGESYDPGDMTFREQRTVRTVVRELMAQDDLTEDDASLAEVMAATVYVLVKYRAGKDDYTLEQALDLKPSDLEKPGTDDPQ